MFTCQLNCLNMHFSTKPDRYHCVISFTDWTWFYFQNKWFPRFVFCISIVHLLFFRKRRTCTSGSVSLFSPERSISLLSVKLKIMLRTIKLYKQKILCKPIYHLDCGIYWRPVKGNLNWINFINAMTLSARFFKRKKARKLSQRIVWLHYALPFWYSLAVLMKYFKIVWL